MDGFWGKSGKDGIEGEEGSLSIMDIDGGNYFFRSKRDRKG